MNWEGHQDWFHDTTPFGAYMEGVPPPLVTPVPTCSARAAQHAANPYEQAAIPGVNCKADTVPAEG